MKNGFTLLEIVVAASVFSIAVGAMVSLFMFAIQGQRNAIARQNLVENTRFAIERMARQIRLATRDESGSCLGAGNDGSTFAFSGSSLTFLDYRNPARCVTYDVQAGKIVMQQDAEDPVDLTSNDIIINNLEFTVQGERKDDGVQPRVTIFVGATASGGNPQTAPALKIQTTVSVRNLDVP